MRPRRLLALAATLAALAGVAAVSAQAPASLADSSLADPREAQSALARAQAEQRAAAERAARLDREAARAVAAAEKTAHEAAAVAARIQEAEAQIAAGRAQVALIERRREALRQRLAQRQGPVVRLTGALQLLARRPVALSVLRPGSLREAVYLQAMLATMGPEVRRRTSGLRAEIAAGRALQQKALAAAAELRGSQAELAERRQRLAAIESRQRLAMRSAQGIAAREADRALALAEETRDLDALVGRLAEAGALRRELAELPGPVLRPAQPGAARVVAEAPVEDGQAAIDYILPVTGRLVAGFGSQSPEGLRSEGVVFAPRGGAQVVAPAAGRIAFAGPYRGYGRIVIIEHPGGWTTLVTNLARVSRSVGEEVVQGAPLGAAAPTRPLVTLELRQDGSPVNPLPLVRG